jgi:pimeloyl-ACP methyl ester carboxylesterase
MLLIMAFRFLLTTLLLVLGPVSAKQCQDITVSVDISARNGQFNLFIPTTNIDMTNFIVNSVRNGHNYTEKVLTGYDTIFGTCNLQTTFCRPDGRFGKSGDTVQLLTYGIGFDRSYWDIPYQSPKYSYVTTAVDQYRFATFAWDRLGIGMSQHSRPLQEIQAPLEEAALISLTQMLKEGSIPSVPKFSRVVHVGHSFGSILSFALSRDVPDLSNGIVLTGYSHTGMFIPYFALGANFVSIKNSPLASQYDAGYFAAGDASAVQTNFFAPNHFDPDILPFAAQNGHPVSVGELLTLGGTSAGVSNTGAPVLVITGERDIPFCGGDCYATSTANISADSIPAGAREYVPRANPFSTQIVSGAGHGLNMDIGAQDTFESINGWLRQNGFGQRGGPWSRRST